MAASASVEVLFGRSKRLYWRAEMQNRVDAVIAALQALLREAEESRKRSWQNRWEVRRANRWINQLPGAWWGQWRNLKLRARFDGELSTELFISELRALLAYLETNREEIRTASSWPWPFGRRVKTRESEPLDAEFTEVDDTGGKKASSKRQKQNIRLLKD